MEERILIGMCEVTYNGQILNNLADKAILNSSLSYDTVYAGKGNVPRAYTLDLSRSRVTLSIFLTFETYDLLKLIIPSLVEYQNGFRDNPAKINTVGKPLIIHPLEMKDNKDYDIVLWSAIVDPEIPYQRVYDKQQDKMLVNFIAQPVEVDGEFSHMYIGDWKAGDILAAT